MDWWKDGQRIGRQVDRLIIKLAYFAIYLEQQNARGTLAVHRSPTQHKCTGLDAAVRTGPVCVLSRCILYKQITHISHTLTSYQYVTTELSTTASIRQRYLHCAFAKLSGAVYCYWSSLSVCVQWVGGLCGWVCYHDNSKLRPSIFTKLGL